MHPDSTSSGSGRAARWLAGLFPVLVVAAVLVQYGVMWNTETGPTNIGLYLIVPVVLLVLALAQFPSWLRRAWKHRAVMLYGIPIALIFTGAVFYSAHYSLDWRFGVSERSRQLDEIETKVRGIVNNEITRYQEGAKAHEAWAGNGQIPMKGEYIDLEAMGYSNCTDMAPGAKIVPCPHKFAFQTVGSEKTLVMVDKQPWENPFDKSKTLPDLIFWLAVFLGSWVSFEQYVSNLPGPRPESA